MSNQLVWVLAITIIAYLIGKARHRQQIWYVRWGWGLLWAFLAFTVCGLFIQVP